jgi:hypothetical protein
MAKAKKFDELKSTFNIDVVAEPVSAEIEKSENKSPAPIEQAEEPSKVLTNFDNDVAYVFGILNSTIEKSKEALDCALELAQETENARAFEVVGQLVKQTVDSAEKIIDIHKKLKDIETERKGPTSVTNNAVFVGTTAEALKLLKAKMNEES